MYRHQILFRTAILALAAFLSTNTWASNNGFYLGGQVGWGNVHPSGVHLSEMQYLIGEGLSTTDFTITSFNGTNSDGSGIGGRVYGGWQYNCFFATEFGFSKFTNVPLHGTAAGIDGSTGLPYVITTTGNAKNDAFDFVFKGSIPLPYRTAVFGKFGVAYIESRPGETADVTEAGIVTIVKNSNVQSRWYPTFGLGASYDFTPALVGDLTWQRIQKIGSSEIFSSTDLIALGIVAHFDVW